MPTLDNKLRPTGIAAIGDVPWGTHLCQFYDTKQDLLDMLVPYFRAGLENNEFCMWVTAEPVEEEDAAQALREVMPGFDECLNKGSIEIISYAKWYFHNGVFDVQHVLDTWVKKYEEAAAKGYEGLRLTGNTFWLQRDMWKDFMEYEVAVNDVIGRYRMIAICSYPLAHCDAADVIDVVQCHQFAMVQRGGHWTRLEHAERKRAEEELRQLNTELTETIEQLKTSQQEVVQADKLAALGTLVAGISHELNNPLMGAMNSVQYARRLVEDPTTGEVLNQADEALGRMRDVLHNMLLYTRPVEETLVQVHLSEVIERALQLLAADFDSLNITIEKDFPKDLPKPIGKERHLQQVFLNLLMNARDAVEQTAEKTIRIRVFPSNDAVSVQVCDTGIGIPTEIQDKIFDPFFTTKPPGRATGLGLSVSQNIVLDLGGSLTVDSRLGAGSTFTVTLPAKPPTK